MTEYIARKGDICAVELRHSSTFVHGKTERHSTWYIGTIAAASRDGVVKQAIIMQPTESGTPFERHCREYDRNKGYGWSALTISSAEYRAAAKALLGREFASSDALKSAITAA